MLIKGTDVIGLKVITLNSGQVISNVKDLIFDPDEKKIKALLINQGGLFQDPKIILIDNVKNIGKDVVVIDSQDKIKRIGEVSENIKKIAKNETYLINSRVITDTGVDRGHVSNILFDPTTGQVEQLELSQGIKDIRSGKQIINMNDVVTIGKDAIIIKDTLGENDTGKSGGYVMQETTQSDQNIIIAPPLDYDSENNQNENRNQSLTDITENQDNFYNEHFQENDLEKQEKENSKNDEVNNTEEIAFDKAKNTVEDAKQRLEAASDKAKNKAEEYIDNIKDQYQQSQKDLQKQKKDETVGKYLTVNLLTPEDEIIGKRGDMVTHKILDEADKYNLTNIVLNNVSSEPVS